MKNPKRHSGDQVSRQSSLIDGFVRRTPQTPGGNSFSKSRPQPSLSVDDFKRPEGLMPRDRSSNSTIPDGTATGRKSIYKQELNMDDDKRRKPKESKHRVRRFLSKSTSMIMMSLILASGFLVGTAYLRATQIFQGGSTALALNDELDPNKLKGEGDGRVNILMLGRGGDGHTAPDLTDTIMIASVDPIQKDAGLLSIPRDFYVQLPNGGGSMKINSVYANSKNYAISQGKSEKAAQAIGIKAVEQTVESIIGIPIHYHVMVDFSGFEKAVNTVGGVDINVKKPVYEQMVIRNKPYTLDVPVGKQHFNGFRALAYSRSRYTSPRGDFDRSERQRQILVALREKVFTLGTFGNPIKMAQLMDNFGKHVQTNLSLNDLTQIYNLAGDITGDKVKSVGLADPPNSYVTTGFVDNQSVVLPRAGLNVYTEIQSYIRNTFKDGFIRKENPKLLVLNGTPNAGLATLQKAVLKSYGYKVSGIGDAPSKNYRNSVLIDLRNGEKKYTKRYLELRYKTNAIADLPRGIDPGNADFVIILGSVL